MEPRTFNSLIQKIGCCIHIFSNLGEAIIFITKAALKHFTVEFDIRSVEKGVNGEGNGCEEEEIEQQREEEPEIEDDGSKSSEDEHDQDIIPER